MRAAELDAQMRRMGKADLPAYKALRDAMLAAHPEAFTSDAAAESLRSAQSYASRLGVTESGADPVPEIFTLGAWRGNALVGAVSCDHDARRKVRHIGQVVGMMVREEVAGQGLGRALLVGCIDAARAAGLELMTLSVTASNAGAIHLYTSCGFKQYGTLRRAIKIGTVFHDKELMCLPL